MSQFLTTRDVGRILDLDTRTICRWIDQGRLKASRTVGGHRRISRQDLLDFAANQGLILDGVSGGRLRLLIIDDENAMVKSLARAFKPFGAEVGVKLFTSGIDGLLEMTVNRPHAVLLDVVMPDLDGIELCRRVRLRKELNAVCLLVMTANLTPAIVREATEAGATACFQKVGMSPEAILGAIYRHQATLRLAVRRG